MSKNDLERRKTFRVPYKLKVTFSGKFDGEYETEDISPLGIFINIPDPPPINSRVFVSFKLPDSAMPIRTFARVARVIHESKDAESVGIGVQFLSISEFDRKRLVRFLKNVYDQGQVYDSDQYTLADFTSQSILKDLKSGTLPFWSYIEDYKQKGNYIYQKYLLGSSLNRVNLYDKLTNTSREFIMMGSSNYLGLNTHPRVIEAAQKALRKYGSGSVGSPLHTGSYDIHRKLEERLAEFENCEDAMIFPSGYSTNLGCISALVKKDDVVIVDRAAHASILDGCLLSGGTLRTFKHSNMESLERLLNQVKGKYEGKLIIVDGVYSSEGDIAPLPDIFRLAGQYGAEVIVDDAHGTGVTGKNGRGTLDHFNLKGESRIVIGTLSKALAGVGGFVTSDEKVINYIRHYARSAFFSASLPPVIISSVLASLDVLESEPERHQQLVENIRYFKSNLDDMGFDTMNSQSALVPVLVGEDLLLKKFSKRLFEEGLYLSAFPYPAVPKGRERLRTSILSIHTRDDLDQALEIFYRVGKELSFFERKVSSADIAG